MVSELRNSKHEFVVNSLHFLLLRVNTEISLEAFCLNLGPRVPEILRLKTKKLFFTLSITTGSSDRIQMQVDLLQ